MLALSAPAGAAVVGPAEGPVSHSLPRTLAGAGDPWTPERRRPAKPLVATGPVGATRAAVKAAGEQVDVPPTIRPGAKRPFKPQSTSAAEQQTWSGGGLIATTAGKVFGTGGGGVDFVASGNVITSPDGDVVVTVAHAMMDAEGRWSKNLVFVPA